MVFKEVIHHYKLCQIKKQQLYIQLLLFAHDILKGITFFDIAGDKKKENESLDNQQLIMYYKVVGMREVFPLFLLSYRIAKKSKGRNQKNILGWKNFVLGTRKEGRWENGKGQTGTGGHRICYRTKKLSEGFENLCL